MQKIYIWDFPTRLFHWLLVLAIAAQYITAELMDDAMQWHSYGGYFILGLVIFRVLWGVWGAYYAQFNQFVTSPYSVWKYVKSFKRSDYQPSTGHNPLGAYAILFILAVLFIQAISGLFITDDIFFNGPYYTVANEATRDLMNWLHHRGFNAIWIFLALHLFAILIYKLYKKQNLLRSMITGYKHTEKEVKVLPNQHNAAEDHWLKFAIFALMSAIAVYLIVFAFAPDLADEFYYS